MIVNKQGAKGMPENDFLDKGTR